MCYNTATTGEWYEDSVSYTGFLTDETGALVANCGYDPISEAGCVLGGAPYNGIDKSELTVHLRITDLVKTADYSESNVDTLVKPTYHFDKSALRRQIDYCALFAEDAYTAGSYAALQTAVAAAKAVYDADFSSVVEASDAYEQEIAALKATVAALEPSTELTKAQDALRETIEQAKTIEQGDKTTSAFNDLQSAIGTAEAVLNNAASGVDELTSAKAALETAVTTFNNSEKSSELDKDNLADGVYSVYVDMIKMDRVSKSMPDNSMQFTSFL